MFGRVRRCGVAAGLLAICLLAAVTACTGSHAPSTVTPSHLPTPAVSASAPPPAAMAGGACLLLTYKIINAALGTHFDVAAAADTSGTYSCVVQAATAYPNLTLSITATDLTPTDFTADIKPTGSVAVAQLGKIGYSAQIAATSTTGPATEVGWLSGNDRLIIMRYTAAPGASAAGSITDGMVSLARTVDATTV
jgi:hypothetical protein